MNRGTENGHNRRLGLRFFVASSREMPHSTHSRSPAGNYRNTAGGRRPSSGDNRDRHSYSRHFRD